MSSAYWLYHGQNVLIRMVYFSSRSGGPEDHVRILFANKGDASVPISESPISFSCQYKFIAWWELILSLRNEDLFKTATPENILHSLVFSPTDEQLREFSNKRLNRMFWDYEDQLIVSHNTYRDPNLSLASLEHLLRCEEKISLWMGSKDATAQKIWIDTRYKLLGFRSEYYRNIRTAITTLHNISG